MSWPSENTPRQPDGLRVSRTHEPGAPSTVPCIGSMREGLARFMRMFGSSSSSKRRP
jgi:hypothetical protein